MSETEFKIKTEIFEGPLELLLTLIERRKLLINDISLSRVADDFIEHVKKLGSFPMGTTAHFILIASTLLLIKSKSLLPGIELTAEEEGSIENLEARLAIYKKIRDASLHIQKRYGKKVIFLANPPKRISIIFSPNKGMTKESLLSSMKEVISSLPQKEVLPQITVKKMMSLEEMIDKLTEKIQNNLKLNFSDFAGSHEKITSSGVKHMVTKENKIMVIVSFLAMLELVKQGIVEVNQDNFSDDISIETKNVKTPNYF